MPEPFDSFSKPVENADLRVISLGAGVQSTTMALMAAHGEIDPMPDAAIFADTQWEPKAVYRHLEWLEGQLPFPVHRVTAGSLRAEIDKAANPNSKELFASLPLYMEGGGMGRRQCTRNFKINPIIKQIRTLLGVGHGEQVRRGVMVEQWIGISLDEMQRMKDSGKRWITHRWPLIEQRMTRHNCLKWLEDRGLPTPAKSACIGCPLHDNARWRDMRNNDPDTWASAVEADRALRANGPLRGLSSLQYIHRSCVPLERADLSTPEDHGQMSFLDECDGMCGV